MTGILQALLASVSAAVSAVTDEYFEYVTMLLPGNGTNGAQNNTFLDSSSNNFTITRNGNTTQGTFTPYGDNWSNYFDGTGDDLYTGSSVSIGTSAFTVEFWVYPTSLASDSAFFSINGGTTNRFTIAYLTGSFVFRYDATNDIAFTSTLSANKWSHVAVVREGTGANQTKLYLNGVASGTGTVSTNYASDAINIATGRTRGLATMTGYISNARLVIGTAVYTAAFTPPTAPLTAITNTSLLTCQSNRFIDNSTNAFTITRNGDVSVQRFSPFSPTAAYASGTIGGSGYFDGTGDYLTVSNNAAFQLGTGDFTLECWYYPEDISLVALFGLWGPTSSNASYLMYLDTSGNPVWYTSTNGSTQTASLTSTVAVTLRAWNHIVITRLSGTTRIFVNGTSGGSTSTSVSLYAATSQLTIGYNPIGGTPDNVQGYLSDVRILKGTGYSSITVPTAPLTAITNTSLLLNFTNAGIIDNAMMNDLETVGNAQISTTQSKFGGSSMYFDGTGDYLTSNTATTDLYAFGSGDFTIECWVYLNSVVGYGIIYDGRPTTAQTTQPTLFHSGGTIAYYTNGANRIVGSALSTSTWYHIALARSGTSTKLFVDGTQVGSTYTDSTVYTNTSGRPWIGADSYSIGNNLLNGYIDDLRVTKGYARYTANFTAPTAAFPTS